MSQNRGPLTSNAINAAKTAGVKHVVVLSTLVADVVSCTFGAQCHVFERAAKLASPLPVTILRLPMFYENNWCADVRRAEWGVAHLATREQGC